MPELSDDLTSLSSSQKDALIIQLAELVRAHISENDLLKAQIEELKARLSLSSQNSSKPPSSDGLNKPVPKSLRKSSQLPSGGQAGHPGKTLEKIAQPNVVITHPVPTHCPACQAVLSPTIKPETRQVIDVPQPNVVVTEHRVEEARCTCGQHVVAAFPQEAASAVQYGSVAQATMVHLTQHHMLPLKRTSELMEEMLGLPVSEATVYQANVKAATRLEPVVKAIAQSIQESRVVHADESGLRVAKELHWLHVAATESLTWMVRHLNRGAKAFADSAVLPDFNGVLVHDGWAPYRALSCEHSLCNAHHLRELTYVHEQMGQAWAKDMIDVLIEANNKIQQHGRLFEHEYAHLRYVYDLVLQAGREANVPPERVPGKRGRVKQSKAANLLNRLTDYAQDVWRFARESDVPFTNNIAEQAVRMPKVKQKISGCFRTPEGADVFCTIRSYLATLQKQGANVFESLVKTFQSTPPHPAGVPQSPYA